MVQPPLPWAAASSSPRATEQSSSRAAAHSSPRAAAFGLGRVFCHGAHGGARNEEAWNFLWNTLFETRRQQRQAHTLMTLRLDKDTGRTEDL